MTTLNHTKTATIRIRILCEPDWMFSRHVYIPQVQKRFLFWIYWKDARWPHSHRSFSTEDQAKEWVENYAKGSWISDYATFNPTKDDAP